MKTLELKIDGMSCGHCVASVRKALETVPGVEVANVGIGTAQLRVEDAAATTVAETIIDAVDDAGYRAELVATP